MTADIQKEKFIHSGPVKCIINLIVFLLYSVIFFVITSIIVLSIFPVVDDVAEKQGGIVFGIVLLLMILTVVFRKSFYMTSSSVERAKNNQELQSRKSLIDQDLFGKSTITFFLVYIVTILLNIQFGAYIAMICSISVYGYLFHKKYKI